MKSLFSMFPEQASTIAKDVDIMYLFSIGVSVFFSALIFVLLFYFSIKYRKSKNPEATPIHGNLALELTWTIIPFIISMVMFFWGTHLFIKNLKPPANSTEIFVVGKQWMWKIQHPEGPREINELHVPINRPIKLLMTSEDVIHSFYIPAFRIKMDVVPGTYTQTWFEATKPGEYHLFCAEYCGTKHSQMIGKVIAMKEVDYEKWLSERIDPATMGSGKGKSIEEQGHHLFGEYRCISCHHADSGALGPDLAGLFGSTVKLQDGKTVTANEKYLRESILNPHAKIVEGYGAIMPTFKNQLSEEQILAIIAYIKSLKVKSGK